MKLKIHRNKKVVAYLDLKHLGGGDYEIDFLRVEPEFRRKGFATALVKKAMAFVKARGNWLVGFLEPRDSITYEQMVAWKKKLGWKHGKYDFGDRHGSNIKRIMFWDANWSREGGAK